MTNRTYFKTLLNHPGRGLVYDAARPWIIAEVSDAEDTVGVIVKRVVSTHETQDAAHASLSRLRAA